MERCERTSGIAGHPLTPNPSPEGEGDWFRLPLCGVFVLLIAGCDEQHFRSETTWHVGGKVDRAIYQPAEFFPQETRSAWQVVRSVKELPSGAFEGSVRDVPVEDSGEARQVVAWGSFVSPEKLPNSLRIPAADPTKFGTLTRNCTIEDLGLVSEYRWNETLTDVVSLADVASARREAMDLIGDVVEISLQDESAYKSDKFILWLRDDAARWLEELHAELVEAGLRGWLRRDRAADSPLPERWADISARHGLGVRTPEGALLANEELTAAIGRFLVDKVRSTVTDADGPPLDEQQARAFLASLGLTEPEQLKWDASPAFEKAIVTRFGTEEAAKQRIAELVTRLLGVYRLGSFLPRRPMHFELTLPGQIVETTGERASDQTIVWNFDAPDAFPFGYAMTARALVPNESIQKKLTGTVIIQSLEQMSQYASLMHADAALRDVMQRCVTDGSLKPFDDYEAEIKKSGTDDAVILSRLKALRRLATKN